jgi:spore germination cell wall hydrolase CwlJ-like protein
MKSYPKTIIVLFILLCLWTLLVFKSTLTKVINAKPQQMIHTVVEKEEPNLPYTQAELHCLTRNAYYEAKGDSEMSQIAVTHAVLNRKYDGAFPGNVCGVVYQKRLNQSGRMVCQFSWYCDQKMMNRKIDRTAWQQSYDAVKKALIFYYDKGIDITQGSTFYHADYVSRNKLGVKNIEKTTQIGSHIYYKEKTK